MDLPDLLTSVGLASSPNYTHRYLAVEATSERGQNFLVAYYEATDKKAGGDFYGDPRGDEYEIDCLQVPLEEVDQFKRQAWLAGISIGQLEDYPAYESCA